MDAATSPLAKIASRPPLTLSSLLSLEPLVWDKLEASDRGHLRLVNRELAVAGLGIVSLAHVRAKPAAPLLPHLPDAPELASLHSRMPCLTFFTMSLGKEFNDPSPSASPGSDEDVAARPMANRVHGAKYMRAYFKSIGHLPKVTSCEVESLVLDAAEIADEEDAGGATTIKYNTVVDLVKCMPNLTKLLVGGTTFPSASSLRSMSSLRSLHSLILDGWVAAAPPGSSEEAVLLEHLALLEPAAATLRFLHLPNCGMFPSLLRLLARVRPGPRGHPMPMPMPHRLHHTDHGMEWQIYSR